MGASLTQFLIGTGRAPPVEALELDRLNLSVMGDQQAALLEPLREILAMLEEQLGP